MFSQAGYIKRITASDSTHNTEYSQSVAISLMGLERRYGAVTRINKGKDVKGIAFEYIEGQLGEKVLSAAYQSFRQELLGYLKLAGHDAYFEQEKKLITRLQQKLPLQFSSEMDKRAYQWEAIEVVLPDGKKTRRLFPLHYVCMLVWHALHDNETFRHNYADHSLEKAQSDLKHRLLTFYKTLDESMQSNICSHGVRNALVLCLNKIHLDVDLIEDIEVALKAECSRLLSEKLSERLIICSASKPDKVLHDALLAWIKDDNGDLGILTELLQVNEQSLLPFLRQHGLSSYEKLDLIVRYQDPSLLVMPKHQALVDALLSAYYFININTSRTCHDKAVVVSEQLDTLSLLMQVSAAPANHLELLIT